jgi:hypothetical protein
MRLTDCHNFQDFPGSWPAGRLPGPIFNYIDGGALRGLANGSFSAVWNSRYGSEAVVWVSSANAAARHHDCIPVRRVQSAAWWRCGQAR